VEIGDSIPEEMYKAVAAILAELYKNKNQSG
jgi:type III secretion system FlhB-like substrate exporter